jgi:hypothetical protein
MGERNGSTGFAIILAGAIGALAWHYLIREVEPDPNFKCAFIAVPEAAAIRLGNLQGPIAKVGITGYLGDPFQENLYDFEGRAKLVVNGQSRSYLARGSVFLWEPGKVGDLSITVAADEYARRDFTLITFDKHGSLSKTPNVAFAFDDPALKLLHPMTYKCSFIGPLPKPTEKSD